MIIKSRHASNYTVIPNDVFKSKLSFEAIGLLTYFLSLPNDWAIKKTTLHSQLNIGRDKIDRMFKELQEVGYINTVRKINGNGTYTYDHIVYDKPYNGEPQADEPHTEKPLTEKGGALISKDIQSTNILNTNKLNKEDKERKFVDSVNSFSEFPQTIRNEFINYWTEKNEKGKMRFETEKFFDKKRRLNTWVTNDKKFKEKKGFVQKKESVNGLEYKPKQEGNLF